MLHRQLCWGLLGARFLCARGVSGHTSLHGRRQLHRGLLGARTSPPMLGTPRCSNITTYVGDSLLLGHRCLRRGLLGARSSPAKPGTPRSSVLGHRQRCRGLLTPRCSVIASDAGDSSVLPWWSDLAMSRRCAIKLLHAVRIRVLILGSTSRVLIRACQTTSVSFQTSFSLPLL